MKITQLQGVQFRMEQSLSEDGELLGVVLTFTDVRQLVPGTEPVPIEVVAIPFDAQAWENFKRHVSADGEISAIEIARQVPTMAVPGA